jgi:hypothetical protein
MDLVREVEVARNDPDIERDSRLLLELHRMTLHARDVCVGIGTEKANGRHGKKAPWPQHATPTPSRKRSTSRSYHQRRRDDNSTARAGGEIASMIDLSAAFTWSSSTFRRDRSWSSALHHLSELFPADAVTRVFRASVGNPIQRPLADVQAAQVFAVGPHRDLDIDLPDRRELVDLQAHLVLWHDDAFASGLATPLPGATCGLIRRG